MLYQYSPSSYYERDMNKLTLSDQEFVDCQVKYRAAIEKKLKEKINFQEIDREMEEHQVPIINDMDYNFYHKFSTLDSKYIFLRNNYHIERLSPEDLEYLQACLKNNQELGDEFLKRTFETVLYETGDLAMLGVPLDENVVPAKSLMFEFACSYADVEDMKVFTYILNYYDNQLKVQLMNEIEKLFQVPTSIHLYDGYGDVFKKGNRSISIQ